jgi:hypothetical protein
MERRRRKRKKKRSCHGEKGDCAAGFCSLLLLLLVAYFSASFERCLLGRKSKNYTFASL